MCISLYIISVSHVSSRWLSHWNWFGEVKFSGTSMACSNLITIKYCKASYFHSNLESWTTLWASMSPVVSKKWLGL